METKPDIWNNEQLVDQLDEIIERGDKLDLILAQIPPLFGESYKATYLGFRAVGLTPYQAMDVLGLDRRLVKYWRENSPKFAQFEDEHIVELQAKVGADIIRLGFMRNMTMLLFKDQLTIRKALVDMDAMSDRDFQYLRTFRRFYSMHELLALEKAINPEKHRDNTITLRFGGNMFEIVEGDVEPQLIAEEAES